MTWLKTTASRLNLNHIEQVTVVGSGPYSLQARTVGGQVEALSGPANGYSTIADALAALDAALGPATVGV